MSHKYSLEVTSADNGYFIEIYNDYSKMRTLISNRENLKNLLLNSVEEMMEYIEEDYNELKI